MAPPELATSVKTDPSITLPADDVRIILQRGSVASKLLDHCRMSDFTSAVLFQRTSVTNEFTGTGPPVIHGRGPAGDGVMALPFGIGHEYPARLRIAVAGTCQDWGLWPLMPLMPNATRSAMLLAGLRLASPRPAVLARGGDASRPPDPPGSAMLLAGLRLASPRPAVPSGDPGCQP